MIFPTAPKISRVGNDLIFDMNIDKQSWAIIIPKGNKTININSVFTKQGCLIRKI
jgi:hypothetical protein